MRSTLVFLILLALAAPATAQPVPAPAGWTADPEHAAYVDRDLRAAFGPVQATVGVWSWRSPEPGGQILAVQTDVGVTGSGGGYVRIRLDELEGIIDVMAADGDQVRRIGWQEKSDPAQKTVEANLEWANDTTGIVSVVRAIWTRAEAPGDTVREVRVECLFAADAVARLRPACDQALKALAPGKEARAPIEVPAVAGTPGDDDVVEAPAEGPEPPQMKETPPGTPAVLAGKPPAPEEATDRRPFYVAGFLLIVVAAMWWNRKKRAELLASEEAAKAKDGKDE